MPGRVTTCRFHVRIRASSSQKPRNKGATIEQLKMGKLGGGISHHRSRALVALEGLIQRLPEIRFRNSLAAGQHRNLGCTLGDMDDI